MMYRIGDASKILRISDQMLRYYEKCGIVNPVRKGDGNYRYYRDLDILMLFQASKFNALGINLADVHELVSDNFTHGLFDNLGIIEQRLNGEISKSKLLLDRIKDIRKHIITCSYNTGLFWVDLMPACYLYRMGASENDSYDFTHLDEKMADQIYSGKAVTFFDPFVEYEDDLETWWFSVEQKYHDVLGIKEYGDYKFIPEHLALFTVVDMGEMGQFSREQYRPIIEKTQKMGYAIDGLVRGLLIGAGTEKEGFSRMLRLQIPIKSL